MISIIIPAYNAESTLPACLQVLKPQLEQPTGFEVIVVDDGSTDNTAQVAVSMGVTVVEQQNSGPAAARNAGVAASTGEIILFTDADCEPSQDWVRQISDALKNREIDGAKGTYKTRQKGLVARFVQQEYQDKYDKMSSDSYIDFIDTYSAAYRRDVFEQNGGFDPTFPMPANEDIEFSFRLASQGCKFVFVPDAVVFHSHVDSVVEYFKRKYFVGFWRVKMYMLHPEKMVSDSHTPQSLKLQVLLVALLLVCIVMGVFFPIFWGAVVGVLAVFLVSAIPFGIKVAKRDFPVTFVAPGLLFVRALALGLGFFWASVQQVIFNQHK